MDRTLDVERMEEALTTADIPTVKKLIRAGFNVNNRDPRGATWLSSACLDGNLKIVELLVNAGANVNDYSKNGRFPLLSALRHSAIVELLLNAGANVDQRLQDEGEENGITPLMDAARDDVGGEYVEVIKLLLRFGASINARSENAATALHWAIRGANFNRIPVTKALITAGIDLNLRDCYGYTALMYVTDEYLNYYLPGYSERRDSPEIVEMLQSARANESGLEHIRLWSSIDEGDDEKIKALIKSGADLNLAKPKGEIALTGPVRGKEHDMVLFLLEEGADVNATPRDRNAETPLIAAIKNKDLQMIEILMDVGADPAAEGPFGSALDYAARIDGKILKYLKSRGSRSKPVQERGLTTEDKDQSIVLVHSDLEAVTKATESLGDGGKVTEDVQGRAVRATGECYVLYQLVGHAWSCILPARAVTGKSHFGPMMANKLSKALKTKAIFYENDDNVVYTGYELFENGKSVEYVYMGPKDCEAAFQWKPGPHALGDDDEDVVKVRSKRRKLKKSDVEFDADFIHNFLVAEDAYVPPWSNRELRITGKSKRYFSKMDRDVFVRVDFITF